MLESAHLINRTKTQAKEIEEYVVSKVETDGQHYAEGLEECKKIECWAARQQLVNIVVALIRQRGAESLNEGVQPASLSMGLLALAIAAETNDLKMVDALKDIGVADESLKSREPDLSSPNTEKLNLFYAKCDTPVYELYPKHEVWLCPIEAAARLGYVAMVMKFIELREAEMEARQEKRKKELGEAKMDRMSSETMKLMKRKCRRAFDWAVKMGHCLVVLRLTNMNYIFLNEASNVLGLLDKADEKVHGVIQTPLALAALSGNFEMVKCLCEQTYSGLRTNGKPWKGKSVIQIAFEELRDTPRGIFSFNPKPRYQIWNYIMDRAESRRELKRLTEERKVHVDAINAILVGTALIATATFAGWLSPPLGYSSPPGTDGPFASVEGHPILESFWVFNSLSFFFSIATFMVGVNVARPPQEYKYIGVVVQSLRWKLQLAYYLVSAAVLFVIGAFASAGFAVLPPIPKYRVNMALTVGIGVTVVAVAVLSTFFGHMFTKSAWQHLDSECGRN